MQTCQFSLSSSEEDDDSGEANSKSCNLADKTGEQHFGRVDKKEVKDAFERGSSRYARGGVASEDNSEDGVCVLPGDEGTSVVR